MSCLIKIRSTRNEMSANEKKLADYILANAALLRDYSSLQLAKAVGVSQSSVVKFCQKLGYSGYPDIKLAINEAVAKSDNGSTGKQKYFQNKALNKVSKKLLQGKLDAVTATIEQNSEESFINASNAIKKATKIQVIGRGIASFIAQNFTTNLISAGKVAFATNDATYQKQFLGSLGKGDALILLSATSELDIDSLMLSDIRKNQVQIILICPYSPSTNYHVSDIILSTISDNDQIDNELCISRRAAQQHIIDILLSF